MRSETQIEKTQNAFTQVAIMNVRKIAFIAIGINRQVKRILIIIHLSEAVRPHLLSQQNLLLMAVQEITAVHIASHIPEKEKQY